MSLYLVPGPVGRLSFTEILDMSLRVSWEEPVNKNGIITGELFLTFPLLLLIRYSIKKKDRNILQQ